MQNRHKGSMWRALPKNLHEPVLNNRQLEALAPNMGHLFKAPPRDVTVDLCSTAQLKELLVAYGVNPSVFSDKAELAAAVRAHCSEEMKASAVELQEKCASQDVRAVVFLGVEGVLSHASGAERLDSESIARLAELLRSSGAHLILCCDWRLSLGLRRKLLKALGDAGIGLSTVAGDTPQLGNTPEATAQEIGAWLEAHPMVERWVALNALDIGAFKPSLEEHVVQVDMEEGLTEKFVQKALEVLSKLWSQPQP